MLKNIVNTVARNCSSRTYSASYRSRSILYRFFSAPADDKLTSIVENPVVGEPEGKNNVWSWVPPKRLNKDQVLKDNFVIPCIPGYK